MILSVDLGATNVKAALFEKNNGQIKKSSETLSVPTSANGGRADIEGALVAAISKLSSENTRILAVSSAGDVDEARAVITYATENLPGMTGYDYRALGGRLGLEAYALNDAHAALLGEVYFGAGRFIKEKRIAMLTLGSGVGGAYFSGGKLCCNRENDFARFGHIILKDGGNACTCGKRGCIETYLSGRAIHRRAEEAGVDGGDIFSLYLKGEPSRVKFVEGLRLDMKAALDKVYEISPFDVCIIGGGVADWMDRAFSPFTGGLGYTVVKAELGNDAGVYGACAHALSKRGEL